MPFSYDEDGRIEMKEDWGDVFGGKVRTQVPEFTYGWDPEQCERDMEELITMAYLALYRAGALPAETKKAKAMKKMSIEITDLMLQRRGSL